MNFEVLLRLFLAREARTERVYGSSVVCYQSVFLRPFLPQLPMLKNYCPKAAMVYRVYVPVTLGFAILSIAAPYQTAVSIQNYVNSLLAIYTLIAGLRLDPGPQTRQILHHRLVVNDGRNLSQHEYAWWIPGTSDSTATRWVQSLMSY